MKRYLILLLLTGILTLSLTVSAAPPTDYILIYEKTDGDPQTTYTVKYYVSNNDKMRVETIEDGTLTMAEICRRDKKALYTLFPASKLYSLEIFDENTWDSLLVGTPIAKLGRKTGTTEFLGLACDVYENITENGADWSLVAQEYGLCLKKVHKENGAVVSQIEATAFTLVQPEASLFEVPAGYLNSMQFGD
jgi:hypothetical protein